MGKSRHLDVGCGSRPQNPFNCDELHGVDLGCRHDSGFEYKQCNVIREPLPYEHSYFDSVLAFSIFQDLPPSVIRPDSHSLIS